MQKYNPDKHYFYVVQNLTDVEQHINIFAKELPKDVNIFHEMDGYKGKPVPLEKGSYCIKTIRKLSPVKQVLFMPMDFRRNENCELIKFSPTIMGYQPHEFAVEFPFNDYINNNSELWVDVPAYANVSLLLTEE